MIELPAPFPFFGGKRKVTSLVWSRFGTIRNYVEPFAGSLAVLLERPLPFSGVETVNDADGLICNFWRALKNAPDQVADFADWSVNENDLHARHAWLVERKDSLQARLEGDPDFYDPKIAGWWVWGMACWIGSGFCSGDGPWRIVEVEGIRKLVHLGSAGRGVNRQLVHLGDAGQGVNRKRDNHRQALFDYFQALADRLRHVRVCCGDWSRVMGDTPMLDHGNGFSPAGVFLDPPYSDRAFRQGDLYRIDDEKVAHAVREWAIAHGYNPHYRIALCGYDGEHTMPKSWECIQGASGQGYGAQSKNGYGNANRERIWFSPHCERQRGLFDRLNDEDGDDLPLQERTLVFAAR